VGVVVYRYISAAVMKIVYIFLIGFMIAKRVQYGGIYTILIMSECTLNERHLTLEASPIYSH
jgi:hypothetical protein